MTDDSLEIHAVRLYGEGRPVDVLVEDGRIARIRPSTSTDGRRVLLPGLVDLHTHLREPGGSGETIASGTRAAAAGGYTDVFAMANTVPATDRLERVLAARELAAGASARVHVNAAATLDLAGQALVDVEGLAAAGVRVFTDDGRCVADDGLAYALLQRVAATGTVFAQHAQSPSIVGDGVINEPVADAAGCAGWPPAGEEAIVARDIALSLRTGGRLHVCHLSTAHTVDLLRAGRSLGAPVTGEVTPHHLLLTDHDALDRGAALKVNPPLRSADDVAALRSALRDGVIDVVATDHAPHPAHTKRGGWHEAAFGLTALETALPIVAEVFADGDDVDWRGVARVMSTTPAAIGGIAGLVPVDLAVGEPASVCVVEETPWTVDPDDRHSASGNTPFAGRRFRHRVSQTVLAGRITHGDPS